MTANPVLTLTSGGFSFTVTFDRWDALQPDRARWFYAINDPDDNTVLSGDDLTTVHNPNVCKSGPMVEALSWLIQWLGVSGDHDAERTRELIGMDSDDLYLLREELENDRD